MSYLIFYHPVEQNGCRFKLHGSMQFTRGLPVWANDHLHCIVYPENQKVRAGKRIRFAIVFDESTSPPTLIRQSRDGLLRTHATHRAMPKCFIDHQGNIYRTADSALVMAGEPKLP